MAAGLVDALERRVRTDGGRPLLTWYDTDADVRIELSGKTFANWVDKTVNLMASMGADDAPIIGAPLLLSHPGHWVGNVWVMAGWQIGGEVLALPREALHVVDLAIVGPDNTHPVPGVETVACSLDPMGRAFASPPPAVTDFGEVLAQPDVHWTNAVSGTRPAFRAAADSSRRSAGDIDAVQPSPERVAVAVHPGVDPWLLLQATLIAPLLGGGSAVLISGSGSLEHRTRIADAEQAIPVEVAA